MKRLILVSLVSLASLFSPASPASADVTVKASAMGKGLGMSGNVSTVTYIKGNKMRTETVLGDTTNIMIFDVDAQRLYKFDSKKKEVDAWDMNTFAKSLEGRVDTANMKGSLKPNGRTKDIGGKAAAGYDVEMQVPADFSGMKMTVVVGGPVWIVKGAPGTAEYAAFYKAAAEKGWILSDPQGAKANPGQAKATTEMYRQFAATGGIPYEQEISFKMSGDGPMAGMLAKMNLSMTSTVQSVETGTLAADLFAPPAGYKIKEQK